MSCSSTSTKARSAFTAARADVEKILQEHPDFAAALSLLGLIDAGLARKEDAIREGRRACELLPMSKDAVDGVAFVVNLAQIYTWTGEKDLAIEQLNAALKVPTIFTTERCACIPCGMLYVMIRASKNLWKMRRNRSG